MNNNAKFDIHTGNHGDIRDDFINRLDLMNINRITLFPRLYGFAQSFTSRIPSLFIHQSDDTANQDNSIEQCL